MKFDLRPSRKPRGGSVKITKLFAFSFGMASRLLTATPKNCLILFANRPVVYLRVYLYITRFLGPGHSRFLSAPGPGQWGGGGSFFGIPAERSRFRPNVRNSVRTFKIPAEPSKFWPDVRKNENEKIEFEVQKRASRSFRRRQNSSSEYAYEYSGVKNI